MPKMEEKKLDVCTGLTSEDARRIYRPLMFTVPGKRLIVWKIVAKLTHQSQYQDRLSNMKIKRGQLSPYPNKFEIFGKGYKINKGNCEGVEFSFGAKDPPQSD